MLAGFVIRVCVACCRPQHAVGFHYVVYLYIVFVLVLHRTWRRKQLLLVSPQVDGEGRGWSTLTSQDFVISIIQSAIFLLIKYFQHKLGESLTEFKGAATAGERRGLLVLLWVCIDHIRYAPHMFPICCPYVQKCSLSMREWPHLPICVSHMLKLGPYVDLFFAICYHMLDNIWATYNLVVFENTQHMGHTWAAYGPHMGCPYVAHMWPICFGRSSGSPVAQMQIRGFRFLLGQT